MLKAICFDLWNTLLNNRNFGKERVEILRLHFSSDELNFPDDQLEQAYRASFARENFVQTDEPYRHITNHERFDHICKILKLTLPNHKKLAIIQEFEEVGLNFPPTLKQGVPNLLKKLSKSFKLGLISDTGYTSGKILSQVLDAYGVLQYFSSTVFSDEMNLYKPHPALFKKCLEDLNVQPSEAIHIGDLLETDITGAKNYGIRAVWINNAEGFPLINNAIEIKQPDFEINHVTEIETLLPQLTA